MNAGLVRREELSAAAETDLYELFSRHFEGIDRVRFTADLEEKNWVLLITDDGDRLVGFSTLLFYRTTAEGKPLTVVYSGDTVVDPTAWRSSVLSRSWIEAVRRLHRRHGEGPLWWLLITSGFRTYRLLPLFWREFYPRYDRPTPADARRLLDHLASERFGRQYDPAAGVVRFDQPQLLAPHLRGIPAAKLRDPHVAFFDRANPGHERGDELVCLTEIASSNLTPAGQRMVRAGAERGLGEGAST